MDTLALKLLATYLAGVLAVVSPDLKPQRAASIANDVAAVTLSEERAFDDDANGQKTGLLLLSIAYWETGKSWARWIDDGRCNDPVWRETHAPWLRGTTGCDNMKAWSMWQVHVPDDSVEIGKRLVANRQRAISAALAKVRGSFALGIGLCSYSGEKSPKCPKAKRRLDTANEWAVRFPFVASAELAEK